MSDAPAEPTPALPNDALRRAPTRAALATMAAAIQPGSRVGTVRRLRGGISSGMHAVALVGPGAEPGSGGAEPGNGGAERRWVVVRRYGPWRLEHDPQAPKREWATLRALAEIGAPTPRPIWLDAGGTVLGTPAIAISRLPGRGLLNPRDLDGWLRQLAEALATIHATPLASQDQALLLDQRAELARELEPVEPPERIAHRPLGPEVWAALRRWWPRIESEPVEVALVHGDYWPGNTLWRHGRLTGVIDWEQARLGDPTQDVACCRLDLTLLFGTEAADAFMSAYQHAGGRALHRLVFWELVMAFWAIENVDEWVRGYQDLGGTDVQPEEGRARLERFASRALEQAQRVGIEPERES